MYQMYMYASVTDFDSKCSHKTIYVQDCEYKVLERWAIDNSSNYFPFILFF